MYLKDNGIISIISKLHHQNAEVKYILSQQFEDLCVDFCRLISISLSFGQDHIILTLSS